MNYIKLGRVLVFDIDGTLIHRDINKVPNLEHDFKSNGRFIYLRPNFHHLVHHFPFLRHQAHLVLWTSMMRKNAQKIKLYFEELGLNFQKLYCQENCQPNLSKDLRVVARDFDLPVENIYLIDDSPEKRIGNQNLIQIKNYDGTLRTDTEILKLIKHLYNILGMPYQQMSAEDVQVSALKAEMKNLSIKKQKQKEGQGEKREVGRPDKRKKEQENLLQKKEEQNQTKKKKEQQLQEGVAKVKQHVHKVEKKQQREQTESKQQHEPQRSLGLKVESHIQHNFQMQCIVFDINETLLIRLPTKIEGLPVDAKTKHYFIYLRPYLQELFQFLHLHQITVCLWSTIKAHNCEIFTKLLKQRGFQFKQLFSGEQLVDGRKDLNFVAGRIGIPSQAIVLVDDSIRKRVEGQNFVHVSSFNPMDGEDDTLLHLIKQLEKMVCIKQNSQFQQS